MRAAEDKELDPPAFEMTHRDGFTMGARGGRKIGPCYFLPVTRYREYRDYWEPLDHVEAKRRMLLNMRKYETEEQARFREDEQKRKEEEEKQKVGFVAKIMLEREEKAYRELEDAEIQ